jgi:hypothetical protein
MWLGRAEPEIVGALRIAGAIVIPVTLVLAELGACTFVESPA